MLKRNITYENYDGEEVTEEFHFNLSQSELVTLEVEYEEGLAEALERIVKTEDKKQLIAEFKKLVLLTYGVREGNRFIKSDELREAFSQTAAYDALFMELAFNADSAAEFMLGILPREMSRELKNIQEAEKNSQPTASLAPPNLSTNKE